MKPSTNQIIATALKIDIRQVSRAFGEAKRQPSKAIAAIKTIKGAIIAYDQARSETTREEEALARWISLCESIKDLHLMWSEARGSLVGERRDLFIKKWVEVSKNLEELGQLSPLFFNITDRERAPIVRKAKQILDNERKAKKK